MRFVSRYGSHIVSMGGQRLQFVQGRYETSNETEIEFLKKHREFGVSIFEDAPETSEESPKRGRKRAEE